jgi:hypothetical protein
MAEGQKKSRKQSGGKARPPKTFQIYLDANLHNCALVLQVLRDASITVYRHADHFPSDAKDKDWLPFVGRHNLLLLTTDKRFRYNDLERAAVRAYDIQCFEFSGNAAGATKMAEALKLALPKMLKLKRYHHKDFVASISPSGDVKIMWSHKNDRVKTKIRQLKLHLP